MAAGQGVMAVRFPPRRKTLLSLLADGGFHSGAALAKALGLSRTAVWGMVHDLPGLGLEVDAVSGKGYRLARPLDLLDGAAIHGELSAAAKARLSGLEVHDQLDSTNTYLMNQAALGRPGGSACLAEFQSAGRGRIGRSWLSPFGGNICLSLLWRFEDHAAVAGLSLAVGVALLRALRRAGVEGVGLKWPNDLLWRERKLGGILLEVSGEAHGRCAVVVGVGLNVRMAPPAAQAIDQAWTDLDHITGGSPPPRNRLAAWLLEELLQLLADYPERGLPGYIEEWRQWHCCAGRRAALQLGGKMIAGVVAGVSDAGLLVLDCEEGGLREFASGDMRLRLHD
jgi:BirA family biotin operon repressor/biotin-[acetyl-CoA-carboxylase] ligase